MKLVLERLPIRKIKLVSRTYRAGKNYQFPEIIDKFKELQPHEANIICFYIYNRTFNDLKGIKYPDFEIIYQLMSNYKKIKESLNSGSALNHEELLKFLAAVTNLGSNFYKGDESQLLESHLKMRTINF